MKKNLHALADRFIHTKHYAKKVASSIIVAMFLLISLNVSAQSETLATGSFIINMGATNPNTIANGLKPYGLIYDLIRNNNVPIKWVIGRSLSLQSSKPGMWGKFIG